LGFFDGGGDRMAFEIEIDKDLLIISRAEDTDFFEPAIWSLAFIFVGLQVLKGQSIHPFNLADAIEWTIGGIGGLLIIGFGNYKQEWKLDKKSGYATKTFYRWHSRKEYKYVIDHVVEFEVIEQASGNVDIIFPNLVTSGDVSATQGRSLTALIAHLIYPSDFAIRDLLHQSSQQIISALHDFAGCGSGNPVDN
jgi:hypothetical protein